MITLDTEQLYLVTHQCRTGALMRPQAQTRSTRPEQTLAPTKAHPYTDNQALPSPDGFVAPANQAVSVCLALSGQSVIAVPLGVTPRVSSIMGAAETIAGMGSNEKVQFWTYTSVDGGAMFDVNSPV